MSVPAVIQAVDFKQGVSDAWSNIATFIPKLLFFAVVLVVGFLIAKVVLVPPRSPMLLGDAVRGLLGDPLATESYGLAATDRARARFSWDIIAAETGRGIDEVLTPRWEREAAS